MRQFVVYQALTGNVPNEGKGWDHLPGQPDVSYHWVHWVPVPLPLRAGHVSAELVSAVPEYDPELCPWGVTTEEVAALRSGEYMELRGDGQFAPDHPEDDLRAFLQERHDARVAETAALAPAAAPHLGLGG